MPKVLWRSDAGCTTGFSRVTHSIGERLIEDYGHEIHVLAVNYRGDSWSCERPGHEHVTPLRLYRPNTIRADDIYAISAEFEKNLKAYHPDMIIFGRGSPAASNLLKMLAENPGTHLLGIDLEFHHVLVMNSFQIQARSMSDLHRIVQDVAGGESKS